MNDDIVTRLYDLCICCRCGCEQSCSDCEAANEIERLREQVRQLEVERDQWQTQAVRGG